MSKDMALGEPEKSLREIKLAEIARMTAGKLPDITPDSPPVFLSAEDRKAEAEKLFKRICRIVTPQRGQYKVRDGKMRTPIAFKVQERQRILKEMIKFDAHPKTKCGDAA